MTEEGKYSLDAVQNNPDIEGSLRSEINAISTSAKGYYKIGPFYVYHYWMGNKNNLKIDRMAKGESIFFFGQHEGYPFSGTVAYSDAVVNQTSNSSVDVVVDTNNNKIVFHVASWYCYLNLISTYPITGMESY